MRDPKPFTVFVARLAAIAQDNENDESLTPYLVAKHAESLRTIARGLDRIHTQQCNGYPYRAEGDAYRAGYYWDKKSAEAAEARDNRRAERLTGEAYTIASLYGLHVYFQGDPRGLPVYLSDETMTDRTYSTTGIAVPL